ncbi:ChaN family lipoprotein [Atopomonas sediminilitoris]|uniref:ChaN family lipoprotein n=1 Tax=Atopomonas sediminilitoris TaxID=2919919 RepID=UPI001F4E5F28|nr:ChaN family lipoprotein [Atopomonas sediminilitoris]MCJ8168106.1 ChaN family lipoprotein [Atopomonas sediminilitoris]
MNTLLAQCWSVKRGFLLALLLASVCLNTAMAAPAGRIVQLSTQATLSPGELVQALSQAERLIVGEKHDNPQHHAVEQWLAEALNAQRLSGAHLLEMLTPSQEPFVQAIRQTPPRLLLPEDLHWSQGWEWAQYGPLLRSLLNMQAALWAANLDRREIQQIYRAPPVLSGVHSTQAVVQQALRQEIADSHCGLLPASQVPAMLAVQQQRDRRMAERLLAAPAPALLIAGAFHARADRGVPLHVQDLAPKAAVKVLLLLEEGASASAAQADYAWFTQATPSQDYCAQLRDSLRTQSSPTQPANDQ